jgi:glycosyltransferase involved in cell wall biosynthesis
LVDAVAIVRRTHRDVLLVVAGGAVHTELLTTTLGARGDGWLDIGAVAAAQKPVLFRSVDVFVLPSHAENMPNTLLEGMAAGCAVIATPVGAVAEMIADEGNGLLVPVRDIDALVGSLTRLAGDPALRARLGSRAAQDAASYYDLRIVEVALATQYESNAPGITRLC